MNDMFQDRQFDDQNPEKISAEEYTNEPPVEEMPMQEAAPEEPNAAEPTHAGYGYKESPYVNSPYARYSGSNPYQDYQPRSNPQQPFTPGFTAQPAKKKKERKPHSFWRSALAFALTAVMVVGGCMVTAYNVNSRWEERNAKTTQTIESLNQKISELQSQVDRTGGQSVSGSPVSYNGGLTPGEIYAQNVDSVVAITCTVRSTNFYGQSASGTSAGSGFILTEDGYVVTNCHVVEGGTDVTVTLNNGTAYDAKVIGTDATNDVALLKVEAEGLHAVKLGSSDDLIIGDMVVVIGNALGKLTASQTVGYVSGKNREVTTDKTVINMIQTDAAINSGNSGGPLFNMNGEVVGITSAKYSGTSSSGATIEGIGFAIPINDVMNSIGDLKDFGYITGAYLGVTVQDTDAEAAAKFGIPNGAYVASVVDGGAADRAGIQTKDIIIALGDYTVSNITDLTRALRHFKADDTTTVTVVRSGQTLDLEITLDEKPRDLNSEPDDSQTTMPQEGSFDEWFDYFNKYFGNNAG